MDTQGTCCGQQLIARIACGSRTHPAAVALLALPAAKLGKIADQLSERFNAWDGVLRAARWPRRARLRHNLAGSLKATFVTGFG